MHAFARSLATAALIASAVISSSVALPVLNADSTTASAVTGPELTTTAAAPVVDSVVVSSSAENNAHGTRVTIANNQLSTLYAQQGDQAVQEIAPGSTSSFQTGGGRGMAYGLAVRVWNVPTTNFPMGAGNDSTYLQVGWSNQAIGYPYASVYFQNKNDPNFPGYGSTGGNMYLSEGECHDFTTSGSSFRQARYCRNGDWGDDGLKDLTFWVYGPSSQG